MDNIIQPNNNFDFSSLSLGHPSSIQGGAYFTKILNNDKPLYIQTPKSFTKQGFVKCGKKIYVDLMFDNNDEQFIHWVENLESKCQELIYEKGDSWFQNPLDANDIETAFASPIRVYKSGKYYLIRVNVKVNYTTNTPNLKIYNETETPVTIEDVKVDTQLISIIEIQGIKFTSRNFQIEMELKQSMVLNSEEIFESCLIKSSVLRKQTNTIVQTDVQSKMPDQSIKLTSTANASNVNDTLEALDTNNSNIQETLSLLENLSDSILKSEENIPEPAKDNANLKEVSTQRENVLDDLEIEVLDAETEKPDELKEVDIDINKNGNSLETITLKKPNQVYYEIYKEARKKAKKAKQEAIVAFLKAKNIKKTYMLEDLDESDESDLENLSDYSENEFEKEEF
jgi:hypothetical protein